MPSDRTEDPYRRRLRAHAAAELERGERIVAMLPFASVPKLPRQPGGRTGKVRFGIRQSWRRYRPCVVTDRRLLVFDSVYGPHRTVAEVARERGQHPSETMIDLALEKHMDAFFLQPVANENQDWALELMRHPRTVTTFSDSGAHVSQLMDSSLQTHLLSHWVRDKQAFTLEEAVRMLTLVPASLWGFADRGLIREGMAADFVVFDPDTIAALMPEVVDDLPAGARRLTQKTRGIAATVVNGEVLLRDGKHTGALPGQLLRGPLTRA